MEKGKEYTIIMYNEGRVAKYFGEERGVHSFVYKLGGSIWEAKIQAGNIVEGQTGIKERSGFVRTFMHISISDSRYPEINKMLEGN